jgi:hypothetical protein
MGWAGERIIELQEERQRALEGLPRTLEESVQVIGALQEELRDLKKQMASQNSPRERYKDYIIGGIIGAVISMALAALL